MTQLSVVTLIWTAAEDEKLRNTTPSRRVMGGHRPRAGTHSVCRSCASKEIEAAWVTSRQWPDDKKKMKPSLPTATQRTVLQRLRTDAWRSFAKMNVVVGDKLLDRLVTLGWIERRWEGGVLELKLTPPGLEALRAKKFQTILFPKLQRGIWQEGSRDDLAAQTLDRS